MNATVQAVQIPRLAVADVLVQYNGLVLGENTNCVNTGIYTVGKGEVNNTVLAAEPYRRFCGLFGQCIKSAALPAGKKHRNTFLFL